MTKIVVIEDEESVRRNLASMLKFEGHEVLTAPDGEAGLALVLASRPDLVLCDINMPILDGHEVLNALQGDASTIGMPFIFLTANAERSDLRKGMVAGATDFLTKPFTRDDVLLAVNAQLRKSQAQQHATAKATEALEASRIQMRHEIDRAQTLLAHFVELKMTPDSRLHYLSRPKEIASGDILLTRQRPGGGFTVLLGDATGHGLTAAVATLPALAVFETAVAAGTPLAQVLGAVNASLRAHLSGAMFVAAALIEFDPKENLLTLWNGGMPVILLFDGEGNSLGEIVSGNLALGLSDDDQGWTFAQVKCTPGSRAYLFSDGLSECAGADGEDFGVQRLREAIVRNFQFPDRLERIEAEIDRHCAGLAPHDDITLAEISLS